MNRTKLAKVAHEKHIYLTTIGRKTGNPHTVELWFAVATDKIYLSHEGGYTDWMKNILVDDCVHFKIGTTQFNGKARLITEREAFTRGKHVLYLKYYGKASDHIIDDWFSESTIIEITLSKE